jgi:hypothetical protein
MPISRQINSLLLKSNRVLETRLAETSLLDNGTLEEANKQFLGKVREGDITKASVLRLLIMDMQKLPEIKLLNYQLEQCGVAGVVLEHYKIREDLVLAYDLDECMATWTLPIDQAGDYTFMATAYYLSDFVRQFWQDKLGNNLIWYVSPLGQLETAFEMLQIKQQEADAKAKEN